MIAVLLIALLMGVTGENPKNAPTLDFSMPPLPPPSEETIVTRHIQRSLRGSLKLTTGELKLFTGFALGIIRHKCKSVDSQKLFQIQKYIGKRISNTEPTRGGQSKAFEDLIATMSSCSKGESPLPTKVFGTPVRPEKSSLDSFFPLDSLRSLIAHPLEFIKKHTATDEKPAMEPIPEADETKEVPTLNDPKDQVEIVDIPEENKPKNTNIDAKLDKSLSHAEKKEAIDPIFTSEELYKYAVTSPEPETTHNVVYSTHIFIPSSKQSEETGFFSWISNIWFSMSEFFSRIFGMEGRQKRDAPDGDDDTTGMRVFMPISTHDVAPGTGKAAFIDLIDEICRIYCDTCAVHSMAQMNNFKLAARELLKFLFEDKTGIDLVANHYLDPTFIHSLNTCEPSRD